MENPLNIAGAVFLDASLIDAGYMASNGDVSFDTDTKTYGVTRKEVPVPVKIVESTMTEQAKAVRTTGRPQPTTRTPWSALLLKAARSWRPPWSPKRGTMTTPCLPPPT